MLFEDLAICLDIYDLMLKHPLTCWNAKGKIFPNHWKGLDNNNFLLSDAVVCKVELDLGKWLEQLTGGIGWEIWSESESEHYVSYHLKFKKQNAEITLYHSGHALVLIDEKPVFDGDLIEKRNPIAKLSYYNIDDGEKISLHWCNF